MMTGEFDESTASPPRGGPESPGIEAGEVADGAHAGRTFALDAAERSRDRFAFLAETSRVLARSLDYETTLATVAAMALPYLGAWCVVDVCTGDDAVDGGGVAAIRRLAVLHPDPERQRIARELHERYPPHVDDPFGAPRVIRTGRAELIAEVTDTRMEAVARDADHLRLLRALGIGAYLIVPMVARGRMLGAITFVTTELGRRFGDLDLVLAEDLANRAALALDNARLHGDALAARRAAEEARAAAEAASREKTEFLAVVSHELRTPLNAIGGYVALMELGVRGPLSDDQRADLARIQQSQRHVLSLVNGLLRYASVGAGALRFTLGRVPVVEAVADCEAMVAPQFANAGIALERAACDPALAVRADPEKLQQVVLNLLTNALKFTAAGGRVTLACATAGEMVRLAVTDTGRGIAADQVARVFEPFVQLEEGAAREGVGLGLAISRELARGMGGDLTVTSAPGVGSTFTLALPRA